MVRFHLSYITRSSLPEKRAKTARRLVDASYRISTVILLRSRMVPSA
jgi:hypothetical protein